MPALFKQIAPGISVSVSSDHLDNLPGFQLNLDLRKSLRKVACRPSDDTRRVFLGDERGHRMTEEMAVPRSRREAVAAPIVVFFPVSPGDIGSFGVGEPSSPAASSFPDRVPGFFVNEQMQIQRIGR